MLGSHCTQKCDELSSTHKKAIENLRNDSNHKKGGNIPKPIIESMEKCCQNGEELVGIVKKHGILAKREFYTPISIGKCKLSDGKLRRLLPLRDFVIYHSGDGSYTARSQVEKMIAQIKQDKTEKWDNLVGWTGQKERVSWWTFNLHGMATASTGKDYVEELAIAWTESAEKVFNKDKMVVEVIIEASQFGVLLYKPTALEGFEENTLFQPAKKCSPYGMTCPVDPKKTGRPELVSESICYADMGVSVTTQYWDY